MEKTLNSTSNSLRKCKEIICPPHSHTKITVLKENIMKNLYSSRTVVSKPANGLLLFKVAKKKGVGSLHLLVSRLHSSVPKGKERLQ